jgi:phage terminase large subunit-like protein
MATLAQTDTTARQLAEALRLWKVQARDSQVEPAGDWLVWAIITGRGWGKTRTAAETVTEWARSGRCGRMHLIGRTAADIRDTMAHGESGLIAIASKRFRPVYNPSKRLVTWPNGAQALLFSADEPDALRGPQCDGWWADELASWRYGRETWDNLQFGARLGQRVRGIITSTPRPIKLLKDILEQPTTHVTRGSTRENRANLAVSFMTLMEERYEGTRLGHQELDGQILEDNPNALWRRDDIERTRVKDAPAMRRIVVALDPTCTATGDEAGIIVAGCGEDGALYVLADMSLHGTPDQWGRAAIRAYDTFGADRIVYETNQGGEMVASVLRTINSNAALRPVHASRGKYVRAEPIAALYEQGRVHHVGMLPTLEDELCSWTPETGISPNRLDALVYALLDLHQRQAKQIIVR